MLLRFAYLAVSHAFAAVRLLPMSDREKDAEILVLRHQIALLERQLGGDKVTFTPQDRAFLAALLVPLPRDFLRRVRLLVRPDTVLGWHRDVLRRRHARACRPKRPGRPPTVRSIRLLILRLVRENPSWGLRLPRMSSMQLRALEPGCGKMITCVASPCLPGGLPHLCCRPAAAD